MKKFLPIIICLRHDLKKNVSAAALRCYLFSNQFIFTTAPIQIYISIKFQSCCVFYRSGREFEKLHVGFFDIRTDGSKAWVIIHKGLRSHEWAIQREDARFSTRLHQIKKEIFHFWQHGYFLLFRRMEGANIIDNENRFPLYSYYRSKNWVN